MEKMDAVAALAALAQDNRLDIYRLLVQAGPDGMAAGEVANALGIAPNTLSFHFDRLRHAGLVSVARQGRSLIYAARYETMNNLLGYLTENCCGGKPGAVRARSLHARQTRTEAQEGDREMKRMHVHVAVDNLDTAIGFYSTLFAATPSVVKPDYAKWMLDDPRVNFAISMRGARTGLNHLGIQVENESELAEVYERLNKAGAPVLEEGKTTCCYAKSEKSWIDDPAGISWETFLTTGESTNYGNSRPQDVRVAAVALLRGRRAHDRRSTSCFSAPATRRAPSWPNPSCARTGRPLPCLLGRQHAEGSRQSLRAQGACELRLSSRRADIQELAGVRGAGRAEDGFRADCLRQRRG